jgi:hypothetical protein
MTQLIYGLVILAFLLAVVGWFLTQPKDKVVTPDADATVCPMDAQRCLDGVYVGRSGPNCEFVCPDLPTVPIDIQAEIDAKSDKIKVSSPVPLGVIESGDLVEGMARGPWFFEASFPVILTNWDGLIIAEGIATAESQWMTTEFVPFKAELLFGNPYNDGDPDFMKRGSLILKKDNPSGLPEHDDALEIPIRFAP